jgi:hypothetical protein
MASEDTTKELLELYQKCKARGESATFFMETMNVKDITITFKVKPSGSPPAVPGNFQNFRRWKTPSQLRRDQRRKEQFLTKKLEKQTPAKDISEGGNVDESLEARMIEPEDDITLETLESSELCEKLVIIPRHKVDNHNIGIEYDVKEKLDKKGIKVKKLVVERMGGTWKGEFTRCEVIIEPFSAKAIEKMDFEILNCCVLPYT